MAGNYKSAFLEGLYDQYGDSFSLAQHNNNRIDNNRLATFARHLNPNVTDDMSIREMVTDRSTGFSIITQDIFNELDTNSQRAYNNAVLLGDLPLIQSVDHTLLMDYPVESIGANVYNEWTRTDIKPEDIEGGIAGKVDNDGGIAIYQTSPNPTPFRRISYGETKVSANIPFAMFQDDSTSATDDKLYVGYILGEGVIGDYIQVHTDGVLAFESGIGYEISPTGVDFDDFLEVTLRRGTIGQAHAGIIKNDDGTDDTSATLAGVAYVVLGMTYGPQYFTGVPTVWFKVKRQLEFAPKSLTASTSVSSNPVAVIYDYLTNTRYGIGLPIELIDTDAFADAYDICDEQVAAQDRYTFNGSILQDGDHQKHLNEMLKTCDGDLYQSNGKISISVGKYVSPNTNYDISEVDLLAKPQISFTRNSSDLYNRVRGTFIDSSDNYQPVDYPEIASDTYANDDGEELETTFDLPFTTTSLEAQRRAKIELLKSRNKVAVTVRLPLKYAELEINDIVRFSYDQWDWTNKLFSVNSIDLMNSDPLNIHLVLTLQEARSDLWDYSADEEISQNSVKPVTTFTQKTIAAVTNTSVSTTVDINEDKQYVYYVNASWTNPYHPYYSYTAVKMYQQTNGTWYLARTEVLYGDDTVSMPTRYVGQPHRFVITNYTNGGYASPPTVTSNITVSRDTIAPSSITNLTTESLYNKVVLRWTEPTDLDLAGYKIYIYNGDATDTPTQPATEDYLIDKSNAFVHTVVRSSETARFYWIAPVDISGNEGTAVASSAVTLVTEATRYNAGQLYYVADDDSAENAPDEFTEAQRSAMSFNFATGEWSSLPTGWSSSQPTVEAQSGEVIYSLNYAIRELDGPAGTQVVNTEAPYPFLKFTGLVTFSSLNSELGDPSSTLITTIDGAKITTGTIEADRISANSITASKLFLNGSMLEATSSDQLQVAEGGIGTLQVTKNAISSYTVYDRTSNNLDTLAPDRTDPTIYEFWDNNYIYGYEYLRRNNSDRALPTIGSPYSYTGGQRYIYFSSADKRTYSYANRAITSTGREWVDTGFSMAFEVTLIPWSNPFGGSSSLYGQLMQSGRYFSYEIDVGYMTLTSDKADQLGIEYDEHLNFIPLQTLSYFKTIKQDNTDVRSVTMPVFFRPADGLNMKQEYDATDPEGNSSYRGDFVYWPAIRVKHDGLSGYTTTDEYEDTMINLKVEYIAVTDIKR